MYGNAWRPEDEQPHSDEHHVGSLPGRPQDPRGVPDSCTLKPNRWRTLFIPKPLYTVAHEKLQSNSGSTSDFALM